MPSRKLKVILDTNIWISFLITKNFRKLDKLIKNGDVQLLFSNELLEEFIKVANRPKFRKYFTTDDIENLLRTFNSYGKFIIIKSDVKGCRDFKDDFLLNLAIDGKADYLLSGDNDLIELKKIKNTKILSYNRFLEEIE